MSGDGRFWNDVAISKILKLAAGNKVGHVYIGLNGHMSTPAVSHLIRTLNKDGGDSCMGGILLTASHNPGGETEDFGIKFNTPNGGPALEALTNAIFERTKVIDKLKVVENFPEVDLSEAKEIQIEGMKITVFDSTESYLDLMKELFDFESIKQLIKRNDF